MQGHFTFSSCHTHGGRRGTPGSRSGQKQSVVLLGHLVFVSPPILFHDLRAPPAAQAPDTVGNSLHCISDRTVGTFPNKKQSHRSGWPLLKVSWAKTASFSRNWAPLNNQEHSSCHRTERTSELALPHQPHCRGITLLASVTNPDANSNVYGDCKRQVR